jgi:hypothetical protein
MIDNDNFLKKDEFELKMKQIKSDILEEIDNSNKNVMNQEINFSLNNEREINKLKQNYDSVILQVNAMKENLNNILSSQNVNINKVYNNDKNLDKNLLDFKNEINSKIEKIFLNYKNVREIINKFEKKIKKTMKILKNWKKA